MDPNQSQEAANNRSPVGTINLQARLYRYGGGDTPLLQTPRQKASARKALASVSPVEKYVMPHTNVRPMAAGCEETPRKPDAKSLTAKIQEEEIIEEKKPAPSKNFVFSPAAQKSMYSVDPADFVNFISKHEAFSEEFCYMNRLGPYDYQVVPFSEINRKDYLTISARGVTHSFGQDNEFLTIAEWKREQATHNKLTKLPFFQKFRRWRQFGLWKRVMRSERFKKYAKVLNTNLFILDETLRTSLLKIRRFCFSLQKMNLLDYPEVVARAVDDGSDRIRGGFQQVGGSQMALTLGDFRRIQQERLEHIVYEELKTLWKKIVEEIEESCTLSLQKFLEINGFATPQQKAAARQQAEGGGLELSEVGSPAEQKGTAAAANTDAAAGNALAQQRDQLESYTERATTRTQCRKITKFIRVAQYLFDSALAGLSLQTVRKFLNTLRVYSQKMVITDGENLKLLPHKDKEHAELVAKQKAEEEAKIVASKKSAAEMIRPIFVVECLFSISGVAFSPTIFDFQHTIESCIYEAVHVVTSFQPFLTLEVFSPFTAPLAELLGTVGDETGHNQAQQFGSGDAMLQSTSGLKKNPPARAEGGMMTNSDLFQLVVQDATFRKLFSMIGVELRHLFDRVLGESATYQTFVDNYNENVMLEWDILDEAAVVQEKIEAVRDGAEAQYALQPICNKSGENLAEYQLLLTKYQVQIQKIQTMSTTTTLGLFQLNSESMRNTLIPSPLRCWDLLHQFIPNLSGRQTEDLSNALKSAQNTLATLPSNVDEYVTFMSFLSKISAEFKHLQRRCINVLDLFETIKMFNIRIDAKLRSRFFELQMMVNALKTQIQFSQESAEGNVTRFSRELEHDIPKLHELIGEQKERLRSEILSDVKQLEDRGNVLKLLKEIEKQVKKAKSDAQRYNRYQEVLQMDVTEFLDVDDLVTQFNNVSRFWRGVEDWESLSLSWLSKPFVEINVEALQKEVAVFYKIASVSQKTLDESNAAVPVFFDKVLQFKNVLPVVQALRNPALKPRHWEKIIDLIGNINLEDPSFTLGKCLDMRVQDHLDSLSDISGKATAEQALEEMLNRVKKTWADMELNIMPYKDAKDIFILGEMEEVITALEDSLVTINTVAGSRFVDPIREDVEEWQRNLLLFQDNLDEWIQLQKHWMYLESIFGAVDIKKQLPTESQKFAEIDVQWRQIMKETHDNNLAITAGTKPDRLELFRKFNFVLDAIQKSLEDYLQSKRVHFPRFFFLSNDELLEILAQARRIDAVQPHLRKCFDNLVKLKFAGMERTSAEIVGMISGEGEEVSFWKPLKARGNVERWLLEVEEFMVKSVWTILKSGLRDYYSILGREADGSSGLARGVTNTGVETHNPLILFEDLESNAKKYAGNLPVDLQTIGNEAVSAAANAAAADGKDTKPDQTKGSPPQRQGKSQKYKAIEGYTRARWVLEKEAQVVATVDMIIWCQLTEQCFYYADMPPPPSIWEARQAADGKGAVAGDHASLPKKDGPAKKQAKDGVGERMLDDIITEYYVDLLDKWLQINVDQLSELTDLVCRSLSVLQRKSIVALVTQDVHNRDIVETLHKNKITSVHSFKWQQQIRYYWGDQHMGPVVETKQKQEKGFGQVDDNDESDECIVRQVDAKLRYGYEYQGCASRLVITPLTDRCWLTITGALHIKLGASPSGPAGTGKTESTKDLAKGLGRQCVVFNCSEQIDYKMMAKLYSGVCASGSWTCLDEFNRISIEVLSVIAQQLNTIRQALVAGLNEFLFEGNMLRLKNTCGVMITMNPGYAGRTELPDNLKILFRPVSMMVPDYTLIAEIMLFAEGFQAAKRLSGKFTQLFKLSSEQLSQQDHYDFGMRAVKSVLVMAGNLKRDNPYGLGEDVLLISAMRDANVPKFLADDLPLFFAIIQDLFPGAQIPQVEQSALRDSVHHCLTAAKLQVVPSLVLKVIQLYETCNVRFGITLVGPTLGGKTVCYRTLAKAITRLKDIEDGTLKETPSKDGSTTEAKDGEDSQNSSGPSKDDSSEDKGPQRQQHTAHDRAYAKPASTPTVSSGTRKAWHRIRFDVLNPKCITMGELYGEFNELSQEWTDGLGSSLIRAASADDDSADQRWVKWVVFDGPIDALWIENMNTVLDDNMTLCLASGERIKLSWYMRMLFEVQDLAQASPATVSRLGMVYLTASVLGWRPYVKTWMATLPKNRFREQYKTNLYACFEKYVDDGIAWMRKSATEPLATENTQLVISLCHLFSALLNNPNARTAHGVTSKDAVEARARLAAQAEDGGGGDDKKGQVEPKEEKGDAPRRASKDGAPAAGGVGGAGGRARGYFSNGDPPYDHLQELDDKHFDAFMLPTFAFAFAWSIAATCDPKGRTAFAHHLEHVFDSVHFPRGGSIHSGYIDYKWSAEWRHWEDLSSSFSFNADASYFDLLVPTPDTVRFSFLLDKLISVERSTFLTGNSGVGKSVVISKLLLGMKQYCDIVPVTMIFSAQTSSERTQHTVEGKLEKKRKTLLSAPVNKKMVILVDDVNMPALDEYGSQPPIELLRQFQDFKGFYDRKKLFWKEIENAMLLLSAAPPGGGRNHLSPRFVRHSHLICMPPTGPQAMQQIFSSIVNGFLLKFKQEVQMQAAPTISSTIEIYHDISAELLPTPARPHYTFNLRDVSKVFQGILMVKSLHCQSKDVFLRLWIHEMSRVFYDRLIDEHDQRWFLEAMGKSLKQRFRNDYWTAETLKSETLMFGNFMRPGANTFVYEEIKDQKKMINLLEGYNNEYNMNATGTPMQLVFFKDALEHVCRIARVLSQPRGSLMLVGMGGSGRQSLTRLCVSMYDNMARYEIELIRNYGVSNFREDEINVVKLAGCNIDSSSEIVEGGVPTCFLLNDTQILSETFLEDVNNLLNAGEVPNLFPPDMVDEIIQILRPICKDLGRSEAKDELWLYFIERVRHNLHIVLAMSPVGDKLRIRLRMFPSIINCTTADWYQPWPDDALMSVANNLLTIAANDTQMVIPAEYVTPICTNCVLVHQTVIQQAKLFLDQLTRHVHVTPKSYLDLIHSYADMLGEKQQELMGNQNRLSVGVEKIKEANLLVANLQADLDRMRPAIKSKINECLELIPIVRDEQAKSEAIQEKVQADEFVVRTQQQEVGKLQAEALTDLNAAMPALEAAVKALDSLDKKDITEIKSFIKPPPLVMMTMEAVNTLLGEKIDWDTAKRVMLDPQFITRLKDYDKDKIPNSVLKKLAKYIDKAEYSPEEVGKTSKACKSLCMWTHAMHTYSVVAKVVEPKRQLLAQMNEELEAANATLAEKQAELQQVLADVEALRKKLQDTEAEKDGLIAESQLTEQRLKRADILTGGLKSESVRWKHSVEVLDVQITNLIGDVFLSAACISYYGPFTGSYRTELERLWIDGAKTLGNPHSPTFDLKEVMGNPAEIREWSLCGLPADPVSVNNAVMVTRGKRWPLMIDPQSQANKWMKRRGAMKSESAAPTTGKGKAGAGKKDEPAKVGIQFKVIKASHQKLLILLETCIRSGYELLIEDIGETLDPILEPVLQKAYFKNQGRLQIHLGDQDIDYDMNFKVSFTTKMANPHYLPEVSIKVLLINFTVTPDGLEEQLLSTVVEQEIPEAMERKTNLSLSLVEDKQQLKKLEEQVLKLLSDTKGMILDDIVLIDTLQDSKKTSTEIERRVEESEKTAVKIAKVLEAYRPLAIRGSILYFVIADLGGIDPMYQFSLQYFNRLFVDTIVRAQKGRTLDERLATLINDTTRALFLNVCRGLFEEHKLIFSFNIAAMIHRRTGQIPYEQWSLILRGVSPALVTQFAEERRMAKITGDDDGAGAGLQCPEWLVEKQWVMLYGIQQICGFDNLLKDISNSKDAWMNWSGGDNPQVTPLPNNCEDEYMMQHFQKVLLMKALCPDMVLFGCQEYILRSLGEEYTKFDTPSMEEVFKDTRHNIALIFILSTGADPTNMLFRFAEGLGRKLESISLGQGQGPRAQRLIDQGRRDGKWVLLQNCHLCKSWMPYLEKIYELMTNEEGPADPQFRLFLTSMPCDYFPVAILQNGVKLTNEPPKGIRANIKRSLMNITDDDLENAPRPKIWAKLQYGLKFFHAVIQERRKFGPLGWNKRYEFNDSDLETSSTNALNMLATEGGVPWDTLSFVVGEINYGGRVTDDWDRRCLLAILEMYVTPVIVKPHYKYAGLYKLPPVKDLRELAEKLRKKKKEESEAHQANAAAGLNPDGTPMLNPDGTPVEPVDPNAVVPGADGQMPPSPKSQPKKKKPKNQNPDDMNYSVTDFEVFTDAYIPSVDLPEIFGLHANAIITYQQRESDFLLATILGIQPRESGTGAGAKKPEDVVFDLAASQANRVPSIFTREEAHHSTFRLTADGVMESLSTCLFQETRRFNKLLQVMERSLAEIQKAIRGLIVMTGELDAMFTSLQNNYVPKLWETSGYLSVKRLSFWFEDLILRVDFFRGWVRRGQPNAYWISAFYFPQGFLTSVLQGFSRMFHFPVDTLGFQFVPCAFAVPPNLENAAQVEAKEKTHAQYVAQQGGGARRPSTEVGVVARRPSTEIQKKEEPKEKQKEDTEPGAIMVYGMFLDGAQWDYDGFILSDQDPGVMNTQAPCIKFIPKKQDTSLIGETNYDSEFFQYICPVYKTGVRAGTLSTTGLSTNFIIAVSLDTHQKPSYWILKGVAMLTMLNE